MPHKLTLKAPFKPAGDQPQAIKKLVAGIKKGYRRQTLLGTTGSGKTATMSWVIEATQKPTLVISHNKTLAAQLAEEFKQFFPNNAVEYFVSYYDYYQPEAYLPRTDTYIAKDASINDEIDRLRHATLEAVLTRPDVIAVASVSCIYGLGTPANYLDLRLEIELGQTQTRQDILRKLSRLRYARNDTDLLRGTYRVRGDTIDIHPAGEDSVLRLEFYGPKIDRLTVRDDLTGRVIATPKTAAVFPATFFISPAAHLKRALSDIRRELKEQLSRLKRQNKLLEAQRLEQRANYDLEMMEQIGYVSGIENYSRHLDGRLPGEPPATLLDYFLHAYGQDFLVFIDESHMTIPQIGAMPGGDAARKDNLIRFGFRLPSAKDNRPLKFHEFEDRLPQTIFASATPADYERHTSGQVVEQIVRPTGLLDPTIDVRPTKHQIDDVIDEIRQRAAPSEARRQASVGRVLVTTLTKRMAEELSTYLIEMGIKAAYLHSDIDTFERLDILRDLRLGTYDVLVGINLLREGLDLPEVSLVAVMDADKEGFLRSTTSLVQVMGRAARHREGHVIMYADKVTGSMKNAIEETNRRRAIQQRHNKKHKITPRSITKAVREFSKVSGTLAPKVPDTLDALDVSDIPPEELERAIKELTAKMDLAARNLEFEKAARLRDIIKSLKGSIHFSS